MIAIGEINPTGLEVNDFIFMNFFFFFKKCVLVDFKYENKRRE